MQNQNNKTTKQQNNKTENRCRQWCCNFDHTLAEEQYNTYRCQTNKTMHYRCADHVAKSEPRITAEDVKQVLPVRRENNYSVQIAHGPGKNDGSLEDISKDNDCSLGEHF